MRSQALWYCWALLAASTAAKAQDEASLRAWIEREAAVRIEDYADRHLRWEWSVQAYETWTSGELSTLRETSKAYPDHPAQDRVHRIDSILAGQQSDYQFWQRHEDYRLCRTLKNWPDPASAWHDRALVDGRGWALFPQHLSLAMRSSAPVSLGLGQGQLDAHKRQLLPLLTGGLSELYGAQLGGATIRRAADIVEAEFELFRDKSVGTITAQARWHGGWQQWSLVRLDYFFDLPAGRIARVYRPSSPRLDPVLERVVYGSVIQSGQNEDGFRYTLGSISPEPRLFNDLVADPTPSGIDLVRGPATFTSVDNLRRSTSTVAVEIAAPQYASIKGPYNSRWPLIATGWGVLVLVLGTVVVYRIRTR